VAAGWPMTRRSGRGAFEYTYRLDRLMPDKTNWFIVAAVVVTAFLFYVLAPVLTPFLLGALFAYLGDPVVDWLESRKIPRTAAVIIVFCAMLLIFVPLPFLLIPLVQHQMTILLGKLPVYLDWLQVSVVPWLESTLGIDLAQFDLEKVKQALMDHWQKVGGVAAGVTQFISRSWVALLAVIANFILVPLVTFYLLRDWDVFLARIRELFPRSVEPALVRLAGDCDMVLGAFLRGQLLVMLVLGVIYATGLSIVGLDLAILIGLGAGAVSFVPYLGFIVGMLAAGIAAFFQFHDVVHIGYVLLVFGFGQVIESMVLTPVLLGDKIGLHPVLVIFAVMAGGQLFGFFGVLLALPVAAVIMVVLRHAHERYVSSDIYLANQKRAAGKGQNG
jgi:predicted PurR-regulated permease PerM